MQPGVITALVALSLLLLLAGAPRGARAQLSDPAMVAASLRSGANKFLQRNATNDIAAAAADATAPEE